MMLHLCYSDFIITDGIDLATDDSHFRDNFNLDLLTKIVVIAIDFRLSYSVNIVMRC